MLILSKTFCVSIVFLVYRGCIRFSQKRNVAAMISIFNPSIKIKLIQKRFFLRDIIIHARAQPLRLGR